MPSRKRAKGKERKLKQQARQSVSSSSPPSAVGGDITLPEQNIPQQETNLIKCLHGAFVPPRGNPVYDFINTFHEEFAPKDGNIKITNVIVGATRKSFEKHEDVWKDSTLRKMAINYMLYIGTNFLLDDFCIGAARMNSQVIIYLENYDGEGSFISVLSKATEDLTYQIRAEEREVVHFYKKRIPCSCLDKLYSKIKKSQVRGSQCYYCKQTVKSKDLKTCSRCKSAQYCSKECQVLGWPSHKEQCTMFADFYKKCEKGGNYRKE